MTARLSVGECNHDVSPTSLFRTAQDFLKAAEILDPVVASGPFGLVSAQCLELALKAYLMACGMAEEDLKNKISHDLSKAWSRSVEVGLEIVAEIPDWAKHLDAGHEYPYIFRYGRANTGIVLASKDTILDGLSGILAAVQEATGVT